MDAFYAATQSPPVRVMLPKQADLHLVAGQRVQLNGTLYTARDAAHARLQQLLLQNKPLPFELHGQIIYYTGPCPPQQGMPIGSCGPTTSSRMDAFMPNLLRAGLWGTMGKGPRSKAVVEEIKRFGAVYFAALGGGGALLAQCVTQCNCIAFQDLGPEAVYALTVKDFPAIVAIDAMGNDIYTVGRAAYANRQQAE